MAIKTNDKDDGEHRKDQRNLLNGLVVDQRTIDPADPSQSYVRSARWKIAYMGMFFGVMAYVFRVNISIALPFMVKSTASMAASKNTSSNDSHTYVTYNLSTKANTSVVTDELIPQDECPNVEAVLSESLNAEFNWSKQAQGLVLSAFYYGCIFQFPFGWVAGKYGGKRIITVAMVISTLLTFLTPVLARASVYAVIAARSILGLCLGATVPAWFDLLSHWTLPYERSRFIALSWIGIIVGTILGFFTSGLLCAHGFDKGWGSVFYVHGICGVVFIVLWLYIVSDSPETHPRISNAELTLFTSQSRDTNKVGKTQLSVPWKQIFTYRPVWAILITHSMQCVVFVMVLTCLPLYMKGVLKFDIQSNGVFSSLPFISSGVGLALSGVLADHLISRQVMSTTAIRKLLQVVGQLGTAVFILVPGFLTCDQRLWVIACLCLCMGFDAIGNASGFACSAIDMAPRYASIIFGISNSLANVAGIVTPIMVGELTTNDTAAEWRSVFCIATGTAVLGALVFGVFSSSALAPWATGNPTEIEVGREESEVFVTESVVSGEGKSENV